jgi:hypothetical protein
LFGENAATVAARWAPSTLFGAELERRKRRLDAG